MGKILLNGIEYTSGGSSSHIYSTTEQVVGKWIDGKPIYEIVIDCGSLPNNTSKNVTTPNDIEYVIDYRGFCYSENDLTYQRPMPFAANGNNGIRVDLNGGTLRVVTFASWSTYKGILIVQYTKTTD